MVVPLTLLTKGAALLSSEDFSDTVAIAWELLLHDEQETAAAAGEPTYSLFFNIFLFCHSDCCA